MSSTAEEIKNIGIGLVGFAGAFSFLGVILAFDRGLLALGNILFLCGVTLIIGIRQAMQIFRKREHFKGTFSFFLGFILLVIGWHFVGMILEAYGLIVLSSAFWPAIKNFLSDIPVLGWFFSWLSSALFWVPFFGEGLLPKTITIDLL